MKTFNFNWYDSNTCPLAVKIERAVNTCGSADEHFNNIKEFMTVPDLWRFMVACVLYWAEAVRWDDRNRYAVQLSRNIAEHFQELSRMTIPDDTLKEAYGFTQGAHRYLQNELFKTFLWYVKENKTMGIHEWVESQQFVYSDDGQSMIPYKDWKTAKLCS